MHEEVEERFMKKMLSILLAALMLLSMTVAMAEGDSDLAYVQGRGKLVVGITDFAPMDFKDADGNWVGFDADLAAAFAAKLGVEVEFVEIEWDYKVPELNGKAIDCVWNGMTLTPEVTSAMNCTDAYLNNSQVIVMKADKLAELPEEATAETFAGMTFAVEAGSAGEEVALELGLNVTPVTSQAAALMEVAAGTSDAAIIDLLMADAMTGEGTSYADMAFGFPLNDEQYGVGFRVDSDLTALCNEFLAEAAENGLMGELLVKYGMAGE